MAGVTWTEKTAAGSGYTKGSPRAGGPVRILFGAVVFNQGLFVSATADYTEKTVSSSSYTEQTVSSGTWTEREI